MTLRTSARHTIALLALFSIAIVSGFGDDRRPYVGSWSNGRGETLTISQTTIRFAGDEPVRYRDVTRATDGKGFELQITASGEVNAFPGKTLAVEVEGGSLHMIGYASHAAYMQGGEVQSDVTWEKDDADAN